MDGSRKLCTLYCVFSRVARGRIYSGPHVAAPWMGGGGGRQVTGATSDWSVALLSSPLRLHLRPQLHHPTSITSLWSSKPVGNIRSLPYRSRYPIYHIRHLLSYSLNPPSPFRNPPPPSTIKLSSKKGLPVVNFVCALKPPRSRSLRSSISIFPGPRRGSSLGAVVPPLSPPCSPLTLPLGCPQESVPTSAAIESSLSVVL